MRSWASPWQIQRAGNDWDPATRPIQCLSYVKLRTSPVGRTDYERRSDKEGGTGKNPQTVECVVPERLSNPLSERPERVARCLPDAIEIGIVKRRNGRAREGANASSARIAAAGNPTVVRRIVCRRPLVLKKS